MVEQVEGSFTFTALDDKDNLFLVKGNNPLSLIRLPNGVMLYASTAAILYAAVNAAGIDSRNKKFGKHALAQGEQPVPVHCRGEIYVAFREREIQV